ncbi:MAG TPA: hypothetical protein DDW81_06835 [Cryomorphaceae bacterium]|nr:hypothetical protein [Owenweeksia sp.]HBF19798.1 hypothetical protein [Cryomorphaceae bacterium]
MGVTMVGAQRFGKWWNFRRHSSGNVYFNRQILLDRFIWWHRSYLYYPGTFKKRLSKMIFTTSSFYTEPGYNFDISHKVFALIKEKITKRLCDTGLKGMKDDETLSLMVNTSSSQQTIELKGPDIDRKNKFLVYCLWLPYDRIAKSDNLLKVFLTDYFDGLMELFEKYNIPENTIRAIQTEVENEILFNDEYVFDEEPTPEIDLSDLDL